jgi:hypothetical protein
MDKAKQLEESLTSLSELVDKGGETVDTAKDTLLTGVQATNSGVEVVIGIFEEVKELLDKFT